MRIDQLKYFVKVVECKSINKAAEYFYIAQPAMSNTLKKLESEVGAPLLIKNYTGVALTSEGQEFYQASREILKILNETLEKINIIQSMKQETNFQHQVRFAISHGVSLNIMPKLLNLFHQIQPNLEIIISEKNARTCMENLLQGTVDCCVLFVYDNEYREDAIQKMIQSDDLYVKHLRQCDLVALVSNNNPLSNQQKLNVDELIKQPFALLNTNFDSHWVTNSLNKNAQINFEFITDNANMWVEYLINHDKAVGIAADFYPLLMEKYCQKLVQIPIKKAGKIQILYVCLTKMQQAMSNYEKIIEIYVQQY